LVLAGKRDKKSIEDFVRLFVLLVFSTILFPTNNYRPPHTLFVYVDNVKELSHYGWGEAVFAYLVPSITAAKEELERRPTSMNYMDGCVVGLLVCCKHLAPYYYNAYKK
jgi:hypothetical protein